MPADDRPRDVSSSSCSSKDRCSTAMTLRRAKHELVHIVVIGDEAVVVVVAIGREHMTLHACHVATWFQ
jgi:hypothetical protein